MDDLIVFELPEKDPPSVDSFELLASNQTGQNEKNDKNKTEKKEQNQDQNTNLIQLNNENQHEENNNKEGVNALLLDEQTSQQLPLKKPNKKSSSQENSEETQSSFDEIESDSLLRIPSPATVLRENISPTQKSSILDDQHQQQKLWHHQQSQQISQQKSQQIPRHQSQQVTQQHSLQILQQQSMQIPQQQPIQIPQQPMKTPLQQSIQIPQQQSIRIPQQQPIQIPQQQPIQIPRQQSQQVSQQQSQQVSQQQSQQVSQQQSQQVSQQQSQQVSQQQSQQVSQQQSQQVSRQQSQQISQQQSSQISQQSSQYQSPINSQQQQSQQLLQQSQQPLHQTCQQQPYQQQYIQQSSQPQQNKHQKHVRIEEPNQQSSFQRESDSKNLVILVQDKNENKVNEKMSKFNFIEDPTEQNETNLVKGKKDHPQNGYADINIDITLDRQDQSSQPQQDDNNDYLIDFTEIPINNTPSTNTTNQEILDLQPTPQWVTYIQSCLTNLISLQLTIAIHRSKLFSLYDCFRDLQKNFKPDLTLDIPTLKSICGNLIECINKAKQIVYSCSASHWGQSAITWPATTIKDSVKRLREDINDCIIQFNCREPRPNFLISEKELEAQDSVDQLQLKGSLLEYLNRISEQEPQTKQMQQISELIKERLASIGPVEGIQEGPALLHITPFLPSRLNLVLDKKDFVVCQKIGCGTFGSVYKGYMAKSQKPVAIKMLNTHLLGGRQLETFKREVWTMANLNHPSILHLVGVTLTAPFCIITELLKCSLYDRLKFLSATKRSVIALRVSQAMEQLHAARIIHRDLKSANILLDDDDMPRVCDFGLVGFKKRGTKTGFVGTAQWMAPEILRSSPFYDEKVDVYSFAVLLWEMLTQKQPYTNMTQDQMVMAIIEKGLRPEIGNGPEFGPPGLISLIKKCWSEKPSDRPSFPQITTLLFTPECHFIGTDEEEFKKLSSRQQLSSMIIHAYDNCNWQKLDELLSSVTPELCKEDPELINSIIALFPNLNDDRKIKILESLPRYLDLEQFLRSKGYSFIVSLFSQEKPPNSPEVIKASVKMLRTIPLNSKSFRQVKLISYLSKCMDEDALRFLADLCEYEDIAKQVSDHDIPFNVKFGLEMTLLKIYRNILKFTKLRSKVSSCLQPIHLAVAAIHENPAEVCKCLSNYMFTVDHSKLVTNIDIIPKIAEVVPKTPLALDLLSRLFSICSSEDLAEYKKIIHRLLKSNSQFFKNGNEEVYSKLESIDEMMKNNEEEENNNEDKKEEEENAEPRNANNAETNSIQSNIATSSSSINSSHSPVTSAASATTINPDEHLIDPIPVSESFTISRAAASSQEEEHLIDPHPIKKEEEDEHLIDPHPIKKDEDDHLIDPHPIKKDDEDGHLIDPHPIKKDDEDDHLIDPHPIKNDNNDDGIEHLIDPHPIQEEHLIDPHPIENEEEHLIDPHPIQLQIYKSNVLNQNSQEKLVDLIDPAPMNPQFNTQPQYAQQQTYNQSDNSVTRSSSYQYQDTSSCSEKK